MSRKKKEFERDKVVKFTEPPPDRRRRYDWKAIAQQLRDRPGEWAVVFTDDKTSLVNAIRQGNIPALHRDRGFTVRTTENVPGPPRKCTLWAMYDPANDKERSKA